MTAKAVLVLCAQALFIQLTFAQCTSRAAVEASGYAAPYGVPGAAIAYDGPAAPFGYDGFAAPGFAASGLAAPLAFDGYATPYGCDAPGFAGRNVAYDGLYAPALDFTPTSGGGLTVTSASAIPPTGISVISENVYEGNLAISGQIPFVGTTGVEGVLSTAGAGAVNHACGNGINAMVSENTAFAPEYATAFAPATAIVAAPAGPLAPTAFAGAPFVNNAYDAAPCASAFGPTAAYGAYGHSYAL